jgi:hypothetical protein
MSIQRIDIPKKRTHGWQARAYISPGERLTAFSSDKAHGGKRKARLHAERAEVFLKRQAKRLRTLGG